MVYIFTALYCEAKALIEYYGLARDNRISKFRVFANPDENVVLAVTGVGNVAAAVAVATVSQMYGAGKNDFLVNLGSCAGRDAGIFLCNKITDEATGRTFYPDVLYRHGFVEKEVVTVPKVLKNGVAQDDRLYDMEAAGIYQAGSYFYGTHQMSFIKIVSDAGEGEQVSPQSIEKLVASYKRELVAYIDGLRKITVAQKFAQETYDEARVAQIAQDMHCSVVMENELRQNIRYCALSGLSWQTIFDEMYANGKLPAGSKKEGKIYLEEFKRRIL